MNSVLQLRSLFRINNINDIPNNFNMEEFLIKILMKNIDYPIPL
jgi:hypothetical protein